MHKGGILLVTAAVLACSACLGDTAKLEIRSASSGLKPGAEPVPYRIAEARGQLALGNVALALEGFRKAYRDDPASVEALAGIAQCYDEMHRFDLSRLSYERALALAPRDPALLALFAGSLDQQGLEAEASSVRRELASLGAPAAPAAAPTQAVAMASPSTTTPTPALPDAAAPVGRSVTIALPPPRPVETATAEPAITKPMAIAPVGKSVTIALPPIRPAAPAVAVRQPRLERLSLTEVALVTGDGPRWKRPAVTAPVRLAQQALPSRPSELRVLNAARVDKLAARTRAFLGHFGWRSIAVGDAAVVRQRSLIVYPLGSQAAASRLSARLGFAMAPRKDVRQLTILLGRDAAQHPSLRPAG